MFFLLLSVFTFYKRKEKKEKGLQILMAPKICSLVLMLAKSGIKNSDLQPVGSDPHSASRYRVLCASMCLLRVEARTKTMLPDKDGPALGGGQTVENEDPSVSLFREYLRIRTVHPEPDYGETPARHTERHSCPASLPELCLVVVYTR